MTSTYDHRIIQGAESGRFLQTIEAYLQGENGFYEDVFASLGAALGPAPAAPQPPPPAPPRPRAAAAPVAAPEGDITPLLQAVQAATSLIKAFRTHGHLAARLDPLGQEPVGDPALDPDTVHLTPELMRQIPAKILRIYVPGANLEEALPHLQETYCGTIAYEIEHISSHRQRVWLRERIESGVFRQPMDPEERRRLLRRLIAVDSLERFLHKAYLGQKQFSIEGLDMTVPMIDEAIELSAAAGAREVVIGMAHRGRLNVLAHNLGRSYQTIFGEFEGTSTLEVVKAVTEIPQGGTGDVKYHHGHTRTYKLREGGEILVNLEANPSHLEFVDPVVLGATRAAQTDRKGPQPERDPHAAVPIQLHGDAAFPGQGVVAETLNLQGLDGYKVGGSLHLIQNNQIGFTTDFEDSRSTTWASDLAKGYDVPIIHVNADDVEACISAVRLAMAFRTEFGHDVLIDLIGYRRFGHNEADEPAYTQPEMYAQIKRHERASVLYANSLIEAGVVSKEDVDGWLQDELGRAHAPAPGPQGGDQGRAGGRAASTSRRASTSSTARRARPSRPRCPPTSCASSTRELLTVPEGFTVHPKLVKQLERRAEALGAEGGIDWAHAEALAFASLLTEGVPVRLTGQDVERGTFSQRHLVLHDAKTGQTVLADPAPVRRAGADGAAQQPAVGGRLPGLRVRLLAGGAGDARAVGGPVRRLRQRRPGDHRPVHHQRPCEVGPQLAPDAAAAARLRGLGARALLGAARALPAARRRGQHPRREPVDAGPVLPPAAPPGADRQAAPAGDHDAEVAAAAAAGDEPHRAPRRHAVLPRARRAARARWTRSRGSCSAPARSTTT